ARPAGGDARRRLDGRRQPRVGRRAAAAHGDVRRLDRRQGTRPPRRAPRPSRPHRPLALRAAGRRSAGPLFAPPLLDEHRALAVSAAMTGRRALEPLRAAAPAVRALRLIPLFCVVLASATGARTHANAGTPLMWASGLHLLFGNAIIGAVEGALLSRLWPVRRIVAIPT